MESLDTVDDEQLRILGEPPAGTGDDRLAEMLSQSAVPAEPVLGRVLAAAWRAALAAIADGADPEPARSAIAAIGPRVRPRGA